MNRCVTVWSLLIVLGACSGGGDPGAGADAGAAGDSEGERPAALVETEAPLWDDAKAWRLGDAPTVSIGVDAGDEAYMFYRVRDALRLDDGRVVVTDAGAHEVRIYDADGTFLKSQGRQGQGPGEYAEPATMDLFGPTPDGHLLVTDSINARINVLNLQGDYLTQLTIGDAPGAGRPNVIDLFGDGSLLTLAVDGDGRLRGDPGQIIRMQYQLLRYSDEGESLALLARVDARPRIVNEAGGVTHYPFIPFSAEGERVAAGNELWLSTGAEPEIRAVGLDGVETRRVRWVVPDRPAVADVWDRYTEESLAGMTRERDLTLYGALYQQELPLPEYVPTHGAMLADELGNLWLERYRLPWETQPEWDVVDPERGWLGVVETPAGFQVLQITAAEAVGVMRGDDGVTRVQVIPLMK